MAVTLRSLLATPGFRLRLVVPGDDPAALDTPIAWAHSSDLPDPTPWLAARQLLLTDGMHFGGADDSDFAASYVARLRDRGLIAVGFATRIVHDEIPRALVAECRAQGLPLLEVADRTPFMAIIRHVADDAAAEQRARLEWSLEAHRAVARAALRPHGLEAILSELESRLGSWVALYDATGERTHTSARSTIPVALEPRVREAVRSALARGRRSADRRIDAGGGVAVQTIGRGGELRGVLAVGTDTPLDAAGDELVTSVVALASIALEQSRILQTARADLRSGLLELLLSGEIEVARRTAMRLGAAPPADPIRVMLVRRGEERAGAAALEGLLGAHRDAVFFADRDDETVLVSTDARAAHVASALAGAGFVVTGSGSSSWASAGSALAEARRAAEEGARRTSPVFYDDLVEAGMVGALRRSGGDVLARRLLEPLDRLPRTTRDELVASARAWYRNNCAYDPAARAIGVHRHTLRNRLDQLGELLGLDLESFDDRVELWSALQLAPAEP